MITEDWKIIMIDFTGAFRLHKQIPHPKDLDRVDRHLLVKLRSLTKEEASARLKPFLTGLEIDR